MMYAVITLGMHAVTVVVIGVPAAAVVIVACCLVLLVLAEGVLRSQAHRTNVKTAALP